MGFVNNLHALGIFVTSVWIIPSILLPFSIIQNLFGYTTDYTSINNRLCRQYLGIKTQYVNDTKHITKGFVIPNHRTVHADTLIDLDNNRCIGISRREVLIIALPFILLLTLDGRHISINRNNSRVETFQHILQYMNHNAGPVMFYPEGTRLTNAHVTSIEHAKSTLKPGLLKSVYEHRKFPVQLQLSNNKEFILNEKRMIVNRGITVTTFLSKPIYPEDFQTFDDFYNEIAKQWYENWVPPTWSSC
jgi:hypothetical protein